MKYYVLVSNSKEGLVRNLRTLPREDTIVVINSLDTDFISWAVTLCETFGTEHYCTESDGTPATGKNSVIKLFLESEHKYMVQLDGDDFLTKHGIEFYRQLAGTRYPPDMVVLYRQPLLVIPGSHPEGYYENWLLHEWDGLIDSLSEVYQMRYPFDKSAEDYSEHTREFMYELFYNSCDCDEITAWNWAKDRHKFNHQLNKFSESKEYMTRMVFYSRKVAEHVWFDNELLIGEDTIQFLKLKKLAHDGKLRIVRRKENVRPTYIAVRNEDSIMLQHGRNNWSWLKPFLKELDKISDDLPVDYSLPDIL